MDSWVDARRKDFKKSFDDPLRRRENEQIQIRKAQRDAHLTKKRQQIDPQLREDDDFKPAGNAHALTELPAEVIANLSSNDPQRQLEGAKDVRHLLSVQSCPPIQCVINAGLVPRFVDFLGYDDRHELQFEAAWALTNIASGTAAQTSSVVEAGGVERFVRLIDSPHMQVKEQAVWALGNIAGDCVELRDHVVGAGAFQPVLRELMEPDPVVDPAAASKSLNRESRLHLLRYATWTLSNFCRGKNNAPFDLIREALPVLRQLLCANDAEIIADACWAISYMSDTNDGPNQQILDEIIRNGVCGRLVELLGHRSFLVQAPALRAVGNVVSGDDQQTQSMVSYGCIPKLKDLLNSTLKPIRKEACWALSNITAGNNEQIEEVIRCGVIPCIAAALEKGEYEVKREAAWCIANAAAGGSPNQVAAIVQCGCIPPLVSVLDVSDPKVVGVALEAIENILKCGKTRQEEERLSENPYVAVLEEADAFPKLEKLQFLGARNKVQAQAVRIMTQYLDVFVEEEVSQPLQPFGGMN